MSRPDGCIDVVELCVLLQCLGFKVKSLDSSDCNLSQDGEMVRSVVVNCQSSGLHAVLEVATTACSCPPNEKQNSGFWTVSGVSGGKPTDKESGSAILGALPQPTRETIVSQLKDMVASIRDIQALCHEGNRNGNRSTDLGRVNKSASMIDMKTPDKVSLLQNIDSPGRYRSLDTLTSKSEQEALPTPGQLQKKAQELSTDEVKINTKETLQLMCARQSTYTISTPGSFRRRNKTSSPIHAPPNNLLDSLVSAERAAEELRNKLSVIVKDFMEEAKHDSSISSLALDVSKISVLKAAEISKSQFVSSPNLSMPTREEQTKSRLKRFESASTSNLGPTKASVPKEGKFSKLRRLSPNFFTKKDTPGKDEKSKGTPLLKAKIAVPVRSSPKSAEPSPTLNLSRKKFSHVKSTIPRPTSKKETN